MKSSNQKYNLVELILLSNSEYDYMEFQPYKQRGLYILNGINFILYDVHPSEEKKMELIQGIVKNRIKIAMPGKDTKGYFDDMGFDCYKSYDEIVIFSFLHVEKDMEYLAIPFTHNKLCDGVEEFGYLYNGTILNVEKTTRYMEELSRTQHNQFLEEMATVSYGRAQNLIDVFSIATIKKFLEDNFGKPTTIDELNNKFKELSKMHHPDVGGDELMFKAISNGKTYLTDKINHESKLIAS